MPRCMQACRRHYGGDSQNSRHSSAFRSFSVGTGTSEPQNYRLSGVFGVQSNQNLQTVAKSQRWLHSLDSGFRFEKTIRNQEGDLASLFEIKQIVRLMMGNVRYVCLSDMHLGADNSVLTNLRIRRQRGRSV